MLETIYDYAGNYTSKAFLSAKTNEDLYFKKDIDFMLERERRMEAEYRIT